MAVRKWHLAQAVDSFTTLKTVLNELTEEEVHAALDLESSTLRRRSLIDRLISRAVRLNEINFSRQLKEKYRGKTSNQVPR
jgi:regulator of replication initiation timing